jgi:hypothetical protein
MMTVTVSVDGLVSLKCPTNSPKVVFVTSASFTGNLGGLAGANTACQSLANHAGIAGVFKAWLSDSTQDPSMQLTHAPNAYIRVDGIRVADNWSALISGSLQNPIDRDEKGTVQLNADVWTNTAADGKAIQLDNLIFGNPILDCGEWTNGTSSESGQLGNSDGASTRWSFDFRGIGCSGSARLYCFQQ